MGNEIVIRMGTKKQVVVLLKVVLMALFGSLIINASIELSKYMTPIPSLVFPVLVYIGVLLLVCKVVERF